MSRAAFLYNLASFVQLWGRFASLFVSSMPLF